jgi:hypothetical protein
MMALPASSELSGVKTDSLWRICYWALFAAVFTWAIWQRFSLPLDPIANPDTWGYLSPALRKLTGAEFGHTNGRNFLYPGFLYLILSVFADFRAITFVQHLLGLMAGAFFLLTWRRLRIFVPKSLVGSSFDGALGLAGAMIYLFAAETTRIETQLRPEGICGFLISINLYVLIQVVACGFVERRRIAALVFGIATVVSSLLLVSVRPSFGFVGIVALLPVGALSLQRGWGREKIVLSVAAALIATLLFLPEHFLARNDEISQTFLPTMLFVIHADLIRDQIAADLKENAKVPYSRDWLERVHTALSAEIAKSHAADPRRYPLFGFDPEYLWFNESSIAAQLRREFGNDVAGRCAFYRFYYWRTWQRRPLDQLKKVARQIAVYYFPKCPAYTPMKVWPLTDDYQRGVMSLDFSEYRRTTKSLRMAADFMQRTTSLAHTAPVVEQSRLVRLTLRFLAASYLPWLLLALVLSAITFWRPAHWNHLRWLGVLVVFGFAYNGASCLEVAIVNSLEVYRYITAQMYATLLTQLLALWLILEFAFAIRRQRYEGI